MREVADVELLEGTICRFKIVCRRYAPHISLCNYMIGCEPILWI
jgi:hypothetical protein